MGSVFGGLGKIVGPGEGIFGTMLEEREKRKEVEGWGSAIKQQLAESAQTAQSPTPMATRNDAAAKAAQRKATARQRQRRGRTSTILTGLSNAADGKLGG